MISGGEDRPGRNHTISTWLHNRPGDPCEDFSFSGSPGFVMRRRRAGRPQRSEDRTGPASERPKAALDQRKENPHEQTCSSVSDSD
jgi:hypothetical protein